MIECPFCRSEIPDDATACPFCRCVLVDAGQARGRKLPAILHPAVAMAAVIALSGALLAVSLMGKKSIGQAKSPALEPVPASVVEPVREPPREREERGRGQSRGREEPSEGPRDDRLYNDLVEYEKAVTAILAKADQLMKELDAIRQSQDQAQVAKMGEKLNQFIGLRGEMRSLQPIRRLQRSHTHLANSLDLSMRGYRHYMIYMQSGELSELDAGRGDLEKASKYRQRALQDIADQKSKLTPPPPPPAPAPVPEPEPAERPERPSRPERSGRGQRPSEPSPYEQPVQPVEPGVEVPPEDSDYVGDGSTVNHGDSVYEDSGEYLPEEPAPYYPEDGDQYPEAEPEPYYPEAAPGPYYPPQP